MVSTLSSVLLAFFEYYLKIIKQGGKQILIHFLFVFKTADYMEGVWLYLVAWIWSLSSHCVLPKALARYVLTHYFRFVFGNLLFDLLSGGRLDWLPFLCLV